MLAEWAFGEIVRYVLALRCGWRGFWRTGGTGDENDPRSCFEQGLWKGNFETYERTGRVLCGGIMRLMRGNYETYGGDF